MIQRIQTLYLLAGAALLAALLAVRWTWAVEPFTAMGWFTPAVWALTILAAGLGFAAVFFYKNRSLQRTVIGLAQWAVLALLLAVAVAIVLIMVGDTGLGTLPASTPGALLLPVGAYLFYRLARRGVEKDIAKVRSMDRIR